MMNDATIIRMATETVNHLRDAISVSSCSYMIPSYNALVTAARDNHPEDSFLKVLVPLPTKARWNDGSEESEDSPTVEASTAFFSGVDNRRQGRRNDHKDDYETISVAEICALLAQLAIALESLSGSDSSGDPANR